MFVFSNSFGEIPFSSSHTWRLICRLFRADQVVVAFLALFLDLVLAMALLGLRTVESGNESWAHFLFMFLIVSWLGSPVPFDRFLLWLGGFPTKIDYRKERAPLF